MTDTKIPLAGVIGSPIAHSKSPRLHGYWLKTYGISGHYIPIDIDLSDLESVLGMLPKMGFRGVNITIPYKEKVLKLADRVTDQASVIGAANTLTFCDDGMIIADNTDGHGFIQNIRHTHPDWDPSAGPAAVLGAGGAARAVVAGLIESGVSEIRISNRTRTRADIIKTDFGRKVTVYEWSHADEMLFGAMTVVNTTSLGMLGNPPLSLKYNSLSSKALVTDIVYTPLETPFLLAAKEKGCRVVDGLGMLIFQAAPGFERWFNYTPQVTDNLREILLK